MHTDIDQDHFITDILLQIAVEKNKPLEQIKRLLLIMVPENCTKFSEK